MIKNEQQFYSMAHKLVFIFPLATANMNERIITKATNQHKWQ